jgi:hypothetical protein
LRHTEQRIVGDWLPGLHVGHAEVLVHHDLAVPGHEDLDAGGQAVVDILLQQRPQPPEPFFRQADLIRRCQLDAAGAGVHRCDGDESPEHEGKQLSSHDPFLPFPHEPVLG